jgi:FkbM family methyltransferase
MKKIFIDGGARIGESIEYLLDKRKDLEGCDVYFFECNSDHIKTLEEIKNTNQKYNFEVKEEAIWIEDGNMPFYISIDMWGDLGCTLDNSKTEKLDLENPRIVKTIDISKFLDNFSDDDYIILKLDIEGSEYEVVSHLIETGKINKLKEIFIEWHDHFFRGKKNSIGLKEKLSKINIKVNNDWI